MQLVVTNLSTSTHITAIMITVTVATTTPFGV